MHTRWLWLHLILHHRSPNVGINIKYMVASVQLLSDQPQWRMTEILRMSSSFDTRWFDNMLLSLQRFVEREKKFISMGFEICSTTPSKIKTEDLSRRLGKLQCRQDIWTHNWTDNDTSRQFVISISVNRLRMAKKSGSDEFF